MSGDNHRQFSDRADEVARDLFDSIDEELAALGVQRVPVSFHLDASDIMLSRADAVTWAKESVDEGFPSVRFYLENTKGHLVVINLAAFEDPDYQFFP
jgi:hypothetical protein